MSTNFPTSLDSFTNPQATDHEDVVSHSSQHANANDAIAALEAKVGIDGSANASSIDYKITKPTLSKVRYTVGSLAYSATPTPTADNYNIVNLGQLTGGAAFVTPSGTPVDGDWLLIRGQQDSSGGHAVSFDSGYVFTTTVTNTITTTASAYFEILFRYHGGRAKWVAQAINNG